MNDYLNNVMNSAILKAAKAQEANDKKTAFKIKIFGKLTYPMKTQYKPVIPPHKEINNDKSTSDNIGSIKGPIEKV